MKVNESAYSSICLKLFPAGTVNYEHVALAIAFDVVIGLMMANVFFERWWTRALAVDKGVSSLQHVVQRYNDVVPLLGSFFAASVRVLSTIAFSQVFSTCLCNSALLVLCVSLVSFHQKLWSQQMIVLTALQVIMMAVQCFSVAWFIRFVRETY
jgi:hypothetical protein